jgi:hypothetical protein
MGATLLRSVVSLWRSLLFRGINLPRRRQWAAVALARRVLLKTRARPEMTTSTHGTNHCEAFDSSASEWTQPLWLHPTGRGARSLDESPDIVRDFARMAAPIALAAWMFGTALMTSCAPAEVAGGMRMAGAGVSGPPRAAGMSSAVAADVCTPAVQAVAVAAALGR